MDLAALLSQMYAGARPQFQAQQARPAMLPRSGSVRPGYGSIGEKFGQGIGEGITEAYVKPLARQKELEMLWNTPQGKKQRVQSIVELYNKMPTDLRDRYVRTQSVQQTLGSLAPDAEGLITPDAEGLYRPVELLQGKETQEAEVYRGQPELLRRGIEAPLAEKEAGTEAKLAEARIVAPAQANYYGAGALKNIGEYNVDQTLLPERVKTLQSESGLRGAQTAHTKEETRLLPMEAQTRRISAEAHRTSAENTGVENKTESIIRRKVLEDDLNLDKYLGEDDKLIQGKDSLGRPSVDATTSYVWSARKLGRLRGHLSTLSAVSEEYAAKRAPQLLQEATRTVSGLSSLVLSIAGRPETKMKDLVLLKEALDEAITDARMMAEQTEQLTGQKMEKAPLEVLKAKELSAQIATTIQTKGRR